MVDIHSFEKLMTPEGEIALRAAESLQPGEVDYLMHFQMLNKHFPADLVRGALETAILRLEASAKFPEGLAKRIYLTRQALEQATPFEVSSYRAKRYRDLGRAEIIVDLGCSIGGDTLALVSVAPTTGIDNDLLRLKMARANLCAAAKLPEYIFAGEVNFMQADLTRPLPIVSRSSAALFFDPARRVGHRRTYTVRDYQPPLQIIREWLPDFPTLGVKLSPGVKLEELAGYQAEIEFISLHGELKECVLWFGALYQAARRATVLPGGAQMAVDEARFTNQPAVLINTPQMYLYEPDPAILRAGLVRHLAEQIGAAQLDPDIAYLTGRIMTPTPFARAWAIEDWLPFQLKRLRAYLQQRKIGKVTVKKRGSPLEPQALIHDLRLRGDGERVLVLTHLRGEPIVVVCYPPAI